MLRALPAKAKGFSLVELLIVLTIVGILLSLAMPSFSTWMANARARAKADAILNGLQQARAEAVKLNARVDFRLATDTSWSICLVSDNCATPIQTKPAGEGGSNATLDIVPVGARRVTFAGVGLTASNADGSATMTQIDVDVPLATDTWRVLITSGGGQIRMCNPAVSSSSDPNRC